MRHAMKLLACLLVPGSCLASAPMEGVWWLVSFEREYQATGEREYPMGKSPSGFIQFQPCGRMTVIITAEGRKPASSEQERAGLFDSLVSYTGAYRVEGDKWITKVDVAANPAWVGTEQARTFRITGDRLQEQTAWLKRPDDRMARATITYERRPYKAMDISWRSQSDRSVQQDTKAGLNTERVGTAVFANGERATVTAYSTNYAVVDGKRPWSGQYLVKFDDLSTMTIKADGQFDNSTHVSTGSGWFVSGTGRFEGIGGVVQLTTRYTTHEAAQTDWTGWYWRPGRPSLVSVKTLQLPNGEAVYDMRGDWDVAIENYGLWERFGSYKQTFRITQDGKSFSGIRLNDNPPGTYGSAGSPSAQGEVDKGGLKKLDLIAGGGDVLPATWHMSDDGNRLVIDAPERSRHVWTRK